MKRTYITRFGEAVIATKKGEALQEFLGTINLGILNMECKPTFRNSVGGDGLDILLALGRVETRIRSRKVSQKVSTSDIATSFLI